MENTRKELFQLIKTARKLVKKDKTIGDITRARRLSLIDSCNYNDAYLKEDFNFLKDVIFETVNASF